MYSIFLPFTVKRPMNMRTNSPSTFTSSKTTKIGGESVLTDRRGGRDLRRKLGRKDF
jgi:hypothetical protein